MLQRTIKNLAQLFADPPCWCYHYKAPQVCTNCQLVGRERMPEVLEPAPKAKPLAEVIKPERDELAELTQMLRDSPCV